MKTPKKTAQLVSFRRVHHVPDRTDIGLTAHDEGQQFGDCPFHRPAARFQVLKRPRDLSARHGELIFDRIELAFGKPRSAPAASTTTNRLFQKYFVTFHWKQVRVNAKIEVLLCKRVHYLRSCVVALSNQRNQGASGMSPYRFAARVLRRIASCAADSCLR
jgi:hypothetical protein